jgi:hypothetical protein
MVPGGEIYFSGGSHFTERGGHFVAHTIAHFLLAGQLVEAEDSL